MVGGEAGAEVDADHGLVHQDEEQPQSGPQEEDDRAQVGGEVDRDQGQLGGAVAVAPGQHVAGAVIAEVERLEQQEREEEIALVADDQARDANLGPGLRLGEGDHREVDVGVEVQLVGVAVVQVVLVDPPGPARSQQEVDQKEAQQIVAARGAQDLPVPRVVAEEGDLAEGEGQENGVERLHPG